MKKVKNTAGIIVIAVALALTPKSVSAQSVTVTVNTTVDKQAIDGFGAAQARPGLGMAGDGGSGDSAHLLATWPEPYRAQIMDLAFSDLNGIGMTVLRTKISPSLEPALGAWSYYDPDQVWIMREAAARGPVKLMGTVWSPPAWMKTNGSVFFGHCINNVLQTCERDADCGNTCVVGALNFSHYQNFADYILRYVKEFALANGINIYAVSIANEPDASMQWDGCPWYGGAIATFLAQFLSPTFAAQYPAITTKVIAPEAAKWDSVAFAVPLDPFYTGPDWGTPSHPLAPSTLLGPVVTNSTALARVDIVGGHQYNGNLSGALPSQLQNKPRWQTEISAIHNVWSMEDALLWAKDIHDSLIGQAQVSAWLWFQLFNGPAGAEVGSLIGTFGSSFVASKTFWAVGNYSKYIRPGFVRVEAASNNPQVLASAYKDPAMGQLVIVAVNQTSGPVGVLFNVGFSTIATPYVTSANYSLEPFAEQSLAAPVVLPAKSIVTLVAYPPRRTSDLLWRKTDGSTMVWLGGIAATANYPGAKPSNWQTKGVGDFDGNGRGDILWRDPVNGINTFYYNGTAVSQGSPGNLPSDWSISGVGDFVGLTSSDILWRNTNGSIAIWQDGTNTTTHLGALGPEWQIHGVGDFVGTSKADILWRCVSQAPCGQAPSGSVAIWQDGTSVTTWPGARGLDWQIHGVGDFWGDGRSDIFWRQPSTGWTSIWHNGTNYTTTPGLAGGDWPVQAIGDYDGDGKSDILYRHTAGTLHVWLGANPATALTPENPGLDWQVAGAGRFDN